MKNFEVSVNRTRGFDCMGPVISFCNNLKQTCLDCSDGHSQMYEIPHLQYTNITICKRSYNETFQSI